LITLTDEHDDEYLKEFVSSLEFLNKNAQKQVFKRGLEVIEELNTLKKYKAGIHGTRDIARQEFRAAICRYLIGFYEDSIYHSTLSVEMGLLIRLDEELRDEEKAAIHDSINSKDSKPPLSFTFGAVFNEAKKRYDNIIKDVQTEQKIASLIQTRNIHIHASNLTSASILSMKETGIHQINRSLQQLEELEKNSIARLTLKKWLQQARELLTENRVVIANLPSFAWCTKDKNRIHAQSKHNRLLRRPF
jgi:hypothetical protein